MAARKVLNINVGVLGHVDSGKTSLVAALSTNLSTAALDKNPQSKERGITLDLGFSSFTVPLPDHIKSLPWASEHTELQFTLVDCPGHASLIRTIIGGVQIIDMMVLVIDIMKGLQTQTAECLVVGEISTSRMLVVLNKVDLLPEADRAKAVKKAQKRLAATFDMTKFAGVTMLPVAAKPGGGSGFSDGSSSLGLDALKAALVALVPPTPRVPRGPFLFAVDHCFPIKGQGTVMTGTVLQGRVAVNDTIELPALKLKRTVKAMQMFRQPLQAAVQGDRLGICVTQLDAALLERGLAATPGSVPTYSGAIAAAEKIRFYSGVVGSKAKFHVSVGHSTVMATIQAFGLPDGQGVPHEVALQSMIENLSRIALKDDPMTFDFTRDYLHQTKLFGLEGRPACNSSGGHHNAAATHAGDDGDTSDHHFGPQWLYLSFDQPVTAPKDALVIGARFDADIHGESCRLAFYGRLVALVDPQKADELAALRIYKTEYTFKRSGDFAGGTVDPQNTTEPASLRIFKVKEKHGAIERLQPDGCTAICRGLFKKESDLTAFVGLRVLTARGEEGTIEGTFGKSGKFKVHFPGGLAASISAAADISADAVTGSSGTHVQQPAGGTSETGSGTLPGEGGGRRGKTGGRGVGGAGIEGLQIVLTCKRYVYDLDKKKLRQ